MLPVIRSFDRLKKVSADHLIVSEFRNVIVSQVQLPFTNVTTMLSLGVITV